MSIESLTRENNQLKEELANDRKSLNEYKGKYEVLVDELKALKANYDSCNGKNEVHSNQNETISKVLAIANQAVDGICSLEEKWSTIDSKLQSNSDRLDALDQYSRIDSLFLRGVKGIPKGLNGYDFGVRIVEIINELLSPYLKFPIDLYHLNYAHFLPTKSKSKSLIIVKFASRFARNEIFSKRSKLQGTGVVIMEHLTKKNLQLLDDAKAVVGFPNVWTSQTKIYANLEGTVTCIRNYADIENLRARCRTIFPEGLPDGYRAPRKNKSQTFRRPHVPPQTSTSLVEGGSGGNMNSGNWEDSESRLASTIEHQRNKHHNSNTIIAPEHQND